VHNLDSLALSKIVDFAGDKKSEHAADATPAGTAM